MPDKTFADELVKIDQAARLQEVGAELTVVLFRGLMNTEPPRPEFTFEQLVPSNEVTLLGGHGGAGKSLFALTLAAHYAAKVPWFGLVTRGGRVVYVSLEDQGTIMLYRLKKIIEVYGLDAKAVEKNLIILDGSEADGALMVEKSEFGIRSLEDTPLFSEVKTAVLGAGLIVIDNASDAYDGDEVKRRQVRRFIRELRNLARANSAGLLLLAHIDKAAARNGSQGNSYSGSTAWHNSVRSRLALIEKNGGVELVQEKLNLGKKLDRAILLTWHDGVLIPDSNIAEGLDAGDQDDLDKGAVLEAIEAAIADGENIPTARTGPKTTQNVLERYPDLPSHLRGRKGRDAFYNALTALQREETLKAEDYWTAARNQSQRYIVNSTSCVYTPTPPVVEPTKPTKGFSLIPGGSLITETHETHETHDSPKLWIFSAPDGTVIHTRPRDTAQDEVVI